MTSAVADARVLVSSVLAACCLGHADFLVTGDHGLLDRGDYLGVRIVSPREFVDVLEQGREHR